MVVVPFFFLPPASATLAFVLRVAFSLGMMIDLVKMRVSGRVNWVKRAASTANRLKKDDASYGCKGRAGAWC